MVTQAADATSALKVVAALDTAVIAGRLPGQDGLQLARELTGGRSVQRLVLLNDVYPSPRPRMQAPS